MFFKNPLTPSTINTDQLQNIQKNIQKLSPHPKKVKIIAVTKTFNFSAILSAEKQKIFNIGESKIQETQKKINNQTLNPKTKLHLIGHLQSNKVSRAIQLYNIIQSVDSIRLLNKINQTAKNNKKTQKIFLQENTTQNPTQKGFNNIEILKAAEQTTLLSNIKLCGVMSIGENTQNKEKIKKSFFETKKTQEKIKTTINGDCVGLSIGMSNDYILALQAGATHLRLGTILFNTRDEK